MRCKTARAGRDISNRGRYGWRPLRSRLSGEIFSERGANVKVTEHSPGGNGKSRSPNDSLAATHVPARKRTPEEPRRRIPAFPLGGRGSSGPQARRFFFLARRSALSMQKSGKLIDGRQPQRVGGYASRRRRRPCARGVSCPPSCTSTPLYFISSLTQSTHEKTSVRGKKENHVIGATTERADFCYILIFVLAPHASDGLPDRAPLSGKQDKRRRRETSHDCPRAPRA